MTLALVEKAEKPVYEQNGEVQYAVGERVVWKAGLRSGDDYRPDEMLDGTVVCAFQNGPRMTYRIELDREWVDQEDDLSHKKIVVGNVFANSIFRLAES